MRPILEYGSTVWDSHYNGLNDELENVQKRAARFVTRNYSYETGSTSTKLLQNAARNNARRKKKKRMNRRFCVYVPSFRILCFKNGSK